MDNVLENYKYLFHLSYCILTDQQSQVQATKKVYHAFKIYSIIIIIIIQLNNCK